ncbi:MAG: hypothetical protein JWN70_4934 [Planctomycetaceae bacterium]|nr:hypothetical protein [Planctomycetaceae bacterium]
MLMLKTARVIAQELFQENQNASVFEIRVCTEAEVDSPDSEFVMEVVRAYHSVKVDHQSLTRPAWQGSIVHLPHRTRMAYGP